MERSAPRGWSQLASPQGRTSGPSHRGRVPVVAPAEHLGLDLLIAVHRDGHGPLRDQVEHQLRDGIRRGVLHEGTPLPSTRALAAELGVSRGVVVEAYAQLVAEGFL